MVDNPLGIGTDQCHHPSIDPDLLLHHPGTIIDVIMERRAAATGREMKAGEGNRGEMRHMGVENGMRKEKGIERGIKLLLRVM